MLRTRSRGRKYFTLIELLVVIKTYLCPGRTGRTAFSTSGGNAPGINGPHTDYAINWNAFVNWGGRTPDQNGQNTVGVQPPGIGLAGLANTTGTSNLILI